MINVLKNKEFITEVCPNCERNVIVFESCSYLIEKEQKTLECPECVKLKVAEDLEKIEQGGRDFNF